MTAQILQLRDYKSPEQRQMEIERFQADLDGFMSDYDRSLSLPADFPIQYRRDDTAPSEVNVGDI